MPYICIWEYEVEPDSRDEFVRHYKNDGEWVKLFKRAKGYLGTDLMQDQSNKYRFVTIDKWESKMSRDEFMKKFAFEYDTLDKKCGEFTLMEKMIGAFESI